MQSVVGLMGNEGVASALQTSNREVRNDNPEKQIEEGKVKLARKSTERIR